MPGWLKQNKAPAQDGPLSVLECVSKCMKEAARINVGVRSCGTAGVLRADLCGQTRRCCPGADRGVEHRHGGGIVGSVVWLDVATPASVVVMEAYGVTGAAGSYFWSCLLQCARCKAQGRRSTGTGPSAPTLPVADEDGARR